jgi:DNA-binding response OmpR family regulator
MCPQSKRVLLVDDDPQVLEALNLAFEDAGFDVLLAHDGGEGLMRAERDRPDLIVLDMMMPRRSGMNVLERLRSSGDFCPPIIMLTGNDEPRHRKFAESQGVSAFLKKPFEIAELLRIAGSLVEATSSP